MSKNNENMNDVIDVVETSIEETTDTMEDVVESTTTEDSDVNTEELFEEAKKKMSKSSVIVNAIKGFFSKIFNCKLFSCMRRRGGSIGSAADDFMSKHDIPAATTNEVLSRIGKPIKNYFKRATQKLDAFAETSNIGKVLNCAIKVLCIAATAAFVSLVVYCMKDVFIPCLMLVATCVAVYVSIEFILRVLSIGCGCKI